MHKIIWGLACAGMWLGMPGVAVAGPVAVSALPTQTQTQTLSFERVFGSPSLNGAAPRGVRLSPDGRWLTVLRARADERQRYDLWGYDRKTGQWRMLVDSAKLSAGHALSEAEKMQRERLRIGDLKGVVTYQWSADSQQVLVPLEGALWLVGLDGSTKAVGAGEGLLNPALSPKGHFLSFVRGRQLWVAPVVGGTAQAITPEEHADTVHWGEAEFVAQEEMARQEGSWWAPDDAHIAIERFDEAQVGIVTRAAIGASARQLSSSDTPPPAHPMSRWSCG